MDEDKSEQTREIEAALSEVKEPAVEEWGRWEDEIQAKVDKLMAGSRMDRMAILAIGALGLCAVGATAMLGKTVSQIAMAVTNLGQNQQFIVEKLGLMDKPTPTMVTPDISSMNGDKVIVDAKTFDVPKDAVVAPAYEGPATEASEAAKAQLAKDKEAGIIDEFKGSEPDASS